MPETVRRPASASPTADSGPPPPPAAEWRFPRHPRSIGRARTALRRQLALWGVADDVAETAQLLLSELVTNSYRHAGSPPGREIGVRCAFADGRPRVEVADASSALPKRCAPGADEERGRGLLLVTALADEWDVTPRPYGIGKVVWFAVKLPVTSAGTTGGHA